MGLATNSHLSFSAALNQALQEINLIIFLSVGGSTDPFHSPRENRDFHLRRSAPENREIQG